MQNTGGFSDPKFDTVQREFKGQWFGWPNARNACNRNDDEHHLNVIVAGHMSSDSLGLNLFLDNLEKKGVAIVPRSGFNRVSRVRKVRR